jgi:formylglycine-generating enzyme required for sulfatase activity/serine/threonine protein kinase
MQTTAQFLDLLDRLHLLERPQLEALRHSAGREDPRALARQLVQEGVLTAFQVNRLFTGRAAELVLGSYVLLELLGEGGMGAVYKARNWKLGATVALKLIRKERLSNLAAVRRFQREIRVSAQLDHPHVVRAIDADEVAGTHLLVMEYVEGGQDLYRLVKKHGALSIEEACTFIRQAALGLQHASERGLVHRDIKPHNLLVANGQLKILDFGLARLGEADGESTTLTQEGTVMGTMDYLAPEQARDSHQVDIRSDLYSLGCTLYFLLSSRAPFAGGAAAQKVYRHQHEDAPALEAGRTDMPPGLGVVVRKLMAKRPEDRYQTPAALAIDLEAVLTGQPVAAASRREARPRISAGKTVPADNPFARLSQGDTAAQAATTKRLPSQRVGAPRGHHAWPLAFAGGGVLVLALTVAGVLALRQGDAPRPPGDVPVPPLRPPKTTTALELAAAEDRQRQQRAAEAHEAFKQLEAKYNQPEVTFASFTPPVQAFRARHSGTPASVRATELLMRLPSPFDRLDPGKIPSDAHAVWRALGVASPPEVVGVLGTHTRRHWAPTLAIGLDSDGRVVSVGSELVVRRWEPRTGTEMLAGIDTPWRGRAAFLSPDARHVIVLGQDGNVPARRVDVATGTAGAMLEGGDTGQWVNFAYTADHSTLVAATYGSDTAGKGRLVSWDVTTGKKKHDLTIAIGWPSRHPIAVLRDGQTVFLGLTAQRTKTQNVCALKRLDLASGKETVLLSGEPASGIQDGYLALSPDEKSLAVSTYTGTTFLWDLTQNKERFRVSSPGPPAFSRDGKLLATGSGTVFETATGDVHLELAARGRPAFSEDGKQLAVAENDGSIRLWDVATGKELHPLKRLAMGRPCFAPDGTVLAMVRDGGVDFLDCMSWQQRPASLPAAGTDSPRGTGPQAIVGATFLANAPDFLTVSGDGTVKRWEVPSLEEKAAWKLDGHIFLAVSPDGTNTAWRSGADHVTVWYTATKVERIRLQSLPKKDIECLAFAPDGRTAAIGYSIPGWGSVRLYDLNSGQERHNFGDMNRIYQVRYSPDGDRLAAYGYDRVVYLWAPGTGQLVSTISVGQTHISGMEFSIDGKLLIVSDHAGRIILYDAATGVCLDEVQMPGEVQGFSLAPDGHHLATANANGTVYILRLTNRMAPQPLTADAARELQSRTAEQLGVKPAIENRIGMKLQLIPAGRFLMGSLGNEPGRSNPEGPRHPVRIARPFYLGAHEVTVGQFKAFVAATGHRTEAEKTGKGCLRFDQNENVMDSSCTWRFPGFEASDTHPVVGVTWDDAAAFCAWLSKVDGKRYRLPTEAEWEYACRTGTQTAYAFGDGPKDLEQYAWTAKTRQGKIAPVAQLRPNAWGLYDMLGNAWEWCIDGERIYTPACAVDPRGPVGDTAIVRGGSVHPQDTATFYRSAKRFAWSRSVPTTNLTFRVVCEGNINQP